MRIVRGVTRTVILTKNYAIKVPRLKQVGPMRRGWKEYVFAFCHGIMANITEHQLSGLDSVCPVLYGCGLVNVYPRCEPLTEDASPARLSTMLTEVHNADCKRENLGWLNGKLVFVDYDMSRNFCELCVS